MILPEVLRKKVCANLGITLDDGFFTGNITMKKRRTLARAIKSSRDKKNEPNFLKSFSVFLNTNLNIKPKKSNKKNNLL